MSGLKLRGVSKSFGALEVIKDVDLEIKSKEFVVFVGPSGCGKSTLLRMIAGLEDDRPRAISRSAASASTTSILRSAASPWCSRPMRSIRT